MIFIQLQTSTFTATAKLLAVYIICTRTSLMHMRRFDTYMGKCYLFIHQDGTLVEFSGLWTKLLTVFRLVQHLRLKLRRGRLCFLLIGINKISTNRGHKISALMLIAETIYSCLEVFILLRAFSAFSSAVLCALGIWVVCFGGVIFTELKLLYVECA